MTYTHYARYIRVRSEDNPAPADADGVCPVGDAAFEEGIARIVTTQSTPPTSEQYARRIPRLVTAEYLATTQKEPA